MRTTQDMRRYSKSYNSPENKRKRSERGRVAVVARWEKYHASLGDMPIRCDDSKDVCRITVDNFLTRKTTILFFTEGSRLGRYKIDVDGEFWKECGWTEATVRMRKSLARIRRLYVGQ